jgi:hypothetical protein
MYTQTHQCVSPNKTNNCSHSTPKILHTPINNYIFNPLTDFRNRNYKKSPRITSLPNIHKKEKKLAYYYYYRC